jgi:Kelch motif
MAAPTKPVPQITPTGKWINVDTNLDFAPRLNSCFVMVNNSVVGRRAYLIGGYYWLDIDIYNPVTETWSKGAKPPVKFHHTNCVAAQGKVWVVAGWPDNTTMNLDYAYMYDPATDTWNEKTAMPADRRRGSAVTIVSPDETKIYVSHGTTGGHATYPGHNPTSLPYLDVYEIATNSWTALSSNAPNLRDHAQGAWINGRICVGGGRKGAVAGWPRVPETDCYNLANNTWKVEASIPTPTARAGSATTCDGHLLVAGGDAVSGKVYNDVQVFDGTHWEVVAPLLIGRFLGPVAVDCVCNRIHIISGSKSSGYGVEMLNMETYYPSGTVTPCLA